MKKKKFVKRRATHAAAVKRESPSARKEREEQSVHEEIKQKEDLNLHPEKRRELGEKEKQKFDQIEREITDVLKRHDIPLQSEFIVQIRSWFQQMRNANVPPEMREGPGIAAMPMEERDALRESQNASNKSKK